MTNPTLPPTDAQSPNVPPTAQPPRTHVGSLPEMLRFTQDDLAANRAGYMSAAQRQRLERVWKRYAILGAISVFVIIIGATFFIFLGQRNNSPVLSVIGVVMTVVNAAIVGLLAQSRIRLNQDVRGEVVSTQGMITHTVKVFNRAATYVLDLNGERLLVPKAVFFAFDDRTDYVLYRTTASKTLLSAEKV